MIILVPQWHQDDHPSARGESLTLVPGDDDEEEIGMGDSTAPSEGKDQCRTEEARCLEN